MFRTTGDTHGKFTRFSKKNLKKLMLEFSEEDFVLVDGDLGLLWENDKEFHYNLDWLSRLPFTLLWVQGNHENYNMIKDYPLEEWNGGLVRHIVRNKIILLERGQVFHLNDKTFFTFGGAKTNDMDVPPLNKDDVDFKFLKKKYRKENKFFRVVDESWWEEELPTEEELQLARNNLDKVNWKVDYVFTHCVSNKVVQTMDVSDKKKQPNLLMNFFDELEDKLEYTHWYFGHYHQDVQVDDKHTCTYKNFYNVF